MQLNRYPSPSHDDIKEKFSAYRGFKYGKQGTFLGVGSDEIIDLLIRVTCTPGSGTGDKILSKLLLPRMTSVSGMLIVLLLS